MVPEENFDKELFAEYMAKMLTATGKLSVEKSEKKAKAYHPDITGKIQNICYIINKGYYNNLKKVKL